MEGWQRLEIGMRGNQGAATRTVRAVEDYWQERLAVVCAQLEVDHAALAIQCKTQMVTVEYASVAMRSSDAGRQKPALCIAKLFTSALITLLVAQRKLALTDLLHDLLPGTLSVNVLEGVTVAHLLSHTHGLGCVDLQEAPVDAAGSIAIATVISALQASGRIFAPGKFFSYGTVGYVLLGSIVEQLTQKTFGEVLRDQILSRLGGEGNFSQPVGYSCSQPTICPSSGKGLYLSVNDFLVFAGSFAVPQTNVLDLPQELLTEMFSTQQALPGWSPVFSGCCYGWKNFTNGWYGHNGIDDTQLAYLRINRAGQTAIGLVATSARRNPGALPALLFRNAYPALCFSMAKQPRVISEPDHDHALIGIFGRDHLSFHISLEHDRLMLEIRTSTGNHTAVSHHCWLRAADDNIYFLEKPWQNIMFLQLVTDDNARRYLWDHMQLWPEVADASA